MTKQETLKELCASKGLKLVARYGEARQKRPEMANNWRVTLSYQGRRLTVDFYGGAAITETDVTAPLVIYSLCVDARAGEESFEDFCSDFGFDVDSRKAEQTWKLCRSLTPKVRRLLGKDFSLFANAEGP